MKKMNIFWVTVNFCAFAILMSPRAYAYLDPSVATYAIQVVAGLVVALSAVVGIFWRKARKKMADKLGIDENAHKEVEEDVVEISDDAEK